MSQNWFDRSLSSEISHNLELICKPLFSQTPICVIQYQKIYPDGSRTIISNHHDRVIHGYIKPDAKIKQFYTPGFRSGERYSFTKAWGENIQDSTAAKIIASHIKTDIELFGVGDEFEIIDYKPNYDEYFSFCTKNKTGEMANFYINQLSSLEQFRLYFLDAAHHLIKAADKNRAVKPWRNINSNVTYIDPSTTQEIIINDSYPRQIPSELKLNHLRINRFYFQTNGITQYLTKREIDCALQLVMGKNNVEIAKSLFISSRTVETHLDSLRTKTGISSRQQLIDFFLQSGLSRLIY